MALTETQLDYIATSVQGLGLNAEPLRPLRLRSLSHEHVRVSNFGVVRMPITCPTISIGAIGPIFRLRPMEP